jgi:hypothetical protein
LPQQLRQLVFLPPLLCMAGRLLKISPPSESQARVRTTDRCGSNLPVPARRSEGRGIGASRPLWRTPAIVSFLNPSRHSGLSTGTALDAPELTFMTSLANGRVVSEAGIRMLIPGSRQRV